MSELAKRNLQGWKPQAPDPRDKTFSAAKHVNLAALPTSVDLAGKCGPILDQGQLGSCTANAIAAAITYAQGACGEPKPFTSSRLFVYYNERAAEGTVNQDAGAVIRDGIKSVNKFGAPPESLWDYDQDFRKKPSDAAYVEALNHQAVEYQAVLQTQAEFEGCLAAGFPTVFGFTVYSSFDSIGSNGLMPMPKILERIEGGHAVIAIGYNRAKQLVKVQNSWSAQWGDKGCFYMPYAFFFNPQMASDFWRINKVEVSSPVPPTPIDSWKTVYQGANYRLQEKAA